VSAVVVAALRLETRALLAALTRTRRIRPAARPTWIGETGGREIVVIESGVGPVAARRALAALPADVALLASFGVAGALDPALAPGDIVVPSVVVWEEAGTTGRYEVAAPLVDGVARALVSVLGRPPRTGTLFSASDVLAGVAAKRAAYERHAATAVEMEAAALARHASAHAIPFFALRVVLDPAALSLEALPPNLDTSWASRARLATMPWVWPLLATLRRHAVTAETVLTQAARAALPALAAASDSALDGDT